MWSLLAALALYSTAVSASCDIQNSVAVDLTAAITASVSSGDAVFHIYVDVPVDTVGVGPVSTLNRSTSRSGVESTSMDCLDIVEGTEQGTILGVFHCGNGGEDGHNALWIAQAHAVDGHVPATGDWTVTGKLSTQGSQGYVKVASDGAAFLAYELESSGGNRVAVRRYESLSDLASASDDYREVHLTNKVVDADGDTIAAGNVGTPSIPTIWPFEDGTYNMQLYFHYYTSSDIPGSGNLTFPATGQGVVSDQYDWYGEFATDQNNAMRMAEAVGKIGQRAELKTEDGTRLQIYEAQMADDAEGYYGWLSWRLFVYEVGCEGLPAAMINMTLDANCQTFANPHASVVGDHLYVGAFIPGEAFNADYAASYAGCDDLDECSCPSCAANPMTGAGAPADSGSFMTSIPLSDIPQLGG